MPAWREDVFQAIERQVIGEFTHHQLGQQPRLRQTPLDGLGRRRRDGYVFLTGPAGVFPAHMLDHFQFGGTYFSCSLVSDPMGALPRLTAAGATFFRFAQVVLDPLAGRCAGKLCRPPP